LPQMFTFTSPTVMIVSLALVVATVVLAQARGIHLRPLTRGLFLLGLLLLALAAGGAAINRPEAGHVAVMIDLSPSTRTASYRDPQVLHRRVDALLGPTARRTYYFAADRREATPGSMPADLPAERTIYAPPSDARAVLLFSDGQFDVPLTAPPTFAAIDPHLEQVDDARLLRLEVRDVALVASVAIDGPPRELQVSGAEGPIFVDGPRVILQPLPPATPPLAAPVAARFNPADAWPENDGLSIHPPPPEQRERWWVGRSAPTHDWVAVAPADLPADAASYLRASVVVLDNLPADALSSAQQDRLVQFARDLGGGIVIRGGENAFGAGGYPGSRLEDLSPLSSTPPTPATHWILLVDSSGSMAAPAGASSRWNVAADAVRTVLPSLPPHDSVSLGSFARELRWWSRGIPASEATRLAIPPPDVRPQGPTDLQPAIQSILAAGDGATPTEVLLVSDADTQLQIGELVDPLRRHRIRLHLLATADVGSHNPVRRLVEETGGQFMAQPDPRLWERSTRQLLRAAAPPLLGADPLRVQFTGPLAGLPETTVMPWNQVWPKAAIIPLARADGGPQQILAAHWRVGLGRVAAAAFPAQASQVERLASIVAAPPRDPRFSVSWDSGRELRVSIDAVDGQQLINDLRLVLALRDPDPSVAGTSQTIPQVGPGRYELSLPSPRRNLLAAVHLEERIIAQHAVAGRYAPEFEAIGTNRRSLQALADTSGGRVIEPDEDDRLDLRWPAKRVDLRSWLAAAAAAAIALGLVHWRLS
jgi:hypothetical protein